MTLSQSDISAALDPDALINQAIEISGLRSFGDMGFIEPMKVLLKCIPLHITLHQEGLESIQADFVRCLVNRLRFQHDLNAHPDILQEQVDDPIIVLGLGRSGTTEMQKILSAPNNVQKMAFWRLWNPAPFPDAIPGQPDPRIAQAGSANLVATDNSAVHAAHHMEEQEVDEDWLLGMFTFDDWIWNQMVFSPSYLDWVMARSSAVPFAYMKSLVQYLQWQDGGRKDRPWVMKGVGYIAHMESLLANFPKATILHTHRDPLQTIPSWAKFVSAMWTLRSAPVDKHEIGREVMRYWGMAMDRYLASRDKLGLDRCIVDARYGDVRENPMSIVERVYERAGRKITEPAYQSMAAWHSNNEQHRFGKHEYSLDEFGLSETMINERFGDYIKRFIER